MSNEATKRTVKHLYLSLNKDAKGAPSAQNQLSLRDQLDRADELEDAN
jgi:hypothetical protein